MQDILRELEKPGRDPRPEFKTAAFREGVEALTDLQPGMLLEGVVTNVTNFGAFVDVGVHQDGLVHISALSNKFVKDPREVVKAGDVVKVKVVEVDEKRKRIALTMRLEDAAPTRRGEPGQRPAGRRGPAPTHESQPAAPEVARPRPPREKQTGAPRAAQPGPRQRTEPTAKRQQEPRPHRERVAKPERGNDPRPQRANESKPQRGDELGGAMAEALARALKRG